MLLIIHIIEVFTFILILLFFYRANNKAKKLQHTGPRQGEVEKGKWNELSFFDWWQSVFYLSQEAEKVTSTKIKTIHKTTHKPLKIHLEHLNILKIKALQKITITYIMLSRNYNFWRFKTP